MSRQRPVASVLLFLKFLEKQGIACGRRALFKPLGRGLRPRRGGEGLAAAAAPAAGPGRGSRPLRSGSTASCCLSPSLGDDGRLPQGGSQGPSPRPRRGLRLLVPDGDRPFPAAWGAQFTVSSGDDEGRFHVLIDPEAPEEAVNVPKEQPQDGSPGWVTAARTRGQSARGQSARGARERAAASRLPPPKSHRR